MNALIRKRAHCKGRLTKITNWLTISENLNDVEKLSTRKIALNDILQSYNAIQEAIVLLATEDEPLQDPEDEDVEGLILDAISLIDKSVKSLLVLDQNPNSPKPAQQAVSLPQINLKLPDICIKPFSGLSAEWQSFYEIFEKLVVNNSQLDNLQKLIYLKSYLRDEALKLVDKLQLVETNFDIALDTLRERYEDKYTIIESHLSNLFENLPCLAKVDKGNLRDFLTTVKQNVSALKNLGVPIDQSDLILVHILSRKLDFNIRKAYRLQRDIKKLPTLEDFLSFLEKHCRVLEDLTPTNSVSNKLSPKPAKNYSYLSSASNASVGSKIPAQYSTQKCSYCKLENHNIYKCLKFKGTSNNNKVQFVVNSNLCQNCLSSHPTNNCQSKHRCIVCGASHHTMLHGCQISSNSQNFPQNSNNRNFNGNNGNSNRNANISYNHRSNNENTRTFNSSRNGSSTSSASLDSNPYASQIRDQPRSEFQNLSNQNSSVQRNRNSEAISNSVENSTTLSLFSKQQFHVLLSTAIVTIYSHHREPIKVRCLLDCGSQTSFCTQELVEKLHFKPFSKSLEISGVSDSSINSTQMINLNIRSNLDSQKQFKITCAILNKITVDLPQVALNIEHLKIPSDITLADPQFYQSSKIDMLIGADIYYDLLTPGMIHLGRDKPTLFNTHLGFIVGGKIGLIQNGSEGLSYSTAIAKNVSMFSSIFQTSDLLEKFWSLEEIDQKPILTPENQLCKKIFKSTTLRLPNGQFQVDLPFKSPNEYLKLGDSFTQAKKRFLLLEKRFEKNQDLFDEYKAFIDEYVALNHARIIPLALKNPNNECKFFLPHHPVLRPESSSTKLRVVFDGSMKSSSGVSLNDITLKGFPVQPELFDILLRFRVHKYVLIADIQKMYRNVQVNPHQTFLQNILWRDHPKDELKCVELTSVTYGLNSSSFLSTSCINELAESNSSEYPLASKALLSQTYVDDVLASQDSLNDLQQLYIELNTLLNSAGFHLHKFASNSEEFSQKVLKTPPALRSQSLDIKMENMSNKVLGLKWNSSEDQFCISLPSVENQKCFTKREVLSNIAKMFDPCGYLAPVIVIAKMFMQKIWAIKLDWNDELPPDLLNEWLDFFKKIPYLKHVNIPRCLFHKKKPIRIELHGFADASLLAYAACVYLHVSYSDKTASSRLICSKSRVSPLRTISLPRLELCGALLLARLIDKVSAIFNNMLTFEFVNLWTDSEIVLCWLSAHPSKWSIFVANRTAEIQRLTESFSWRHIPSEENAADPLSRGIYPDKIQHCELWWEGPKFLQEFDPDLSKFKTNISTNIEAFKEERSAKKIALHVSVRNEYWYSKFSKFSNFNRLQRSIAFMFRFIKNSKPNVIKTSEESLSIEELQFSHNFIIKIIQEKGFSNEIACLTNNKILSNKAILSLSPFLDNEGILRVGGRLSRADIPFHQKFPILLPSKDHVVNLMLDKQHLDLYHAGPQTVLSHTRLRYWPLNGLRAIKKLTRECVVCFRLRAQVAQQIMSDLPRFRVSPSRPFVKVGIDFGGPMLVKTSSLRQAKLVKCYFAVFVCMATKATHIEAVSNLSTDAFICTLKRFISRRGNPSVIFTDNATNFQGSRNEIKELYDFFKNSGHNKQIKDFLSLREIQWVFIPPRSPHWGGLWESSIKSTKYHIKRVIGDSHLTFEALSTILAQIEAILNSRPLCALSSDPLDLDVLTPGHFLIGSSLTSFPEKSLQTTNPNRLSMWKNITRIQQSFWKRWSVEYLNQLQNRPKWHVQKQNIKVDDLVLIKEDNVPPLKWPRARVTEVIPSADKRVRLVRLRTKDSEFTRSIAKVCPLPLNN